MEAILATFISMTAFGSHAAVPEQVQSAELRTSMKKRSVRNESPAWAQGLPPKGSREFPAELRRRILDGPATEAVAVVVEFQPAAISQQGDVGHGGVTISGSRVKIVAPKRFKGLEFFVHHRIVPAEDSCWRVTECKVVFTIKERMLEIRQSKELADYATFIYDTDLENIKLTMVSGSPSLGSRAAPDRR